MRADRIARTGATIALTLAAAAPSHAPVPAARESWRDRIRAFAESKLEHTAWGTAHAQRDYALTLELARAEGIAIDEDAVYAAAWLHDIGAFPEFAEAGTDHGERAAALVDDVLREAGFPMAKAPLVRDIVAHHMYYHAPGASPEALLFRDADTLDFLGAIGVARILSITTRHRWAPDLPTAVETVRRNRRELPAALRTASAHREARARVAVMDGFLSGLGVELRGSPP